MKRIQLWNLIIVLLLAACQPITAPPGQSETQTGSYADPNGRFTVPIPTNWTAASKDGYTLLRNPNGQIEIYLLVLEGVTIEDAAAQAWARVDPTFNLTPQSVEDAPSRPGVTRTLHHDYDAGEANLVLIGIYACLHPLRQVLG